MSKKIIILILIVLLGLAAGIGVYWFIVQKSVKNDYFAAKTPAKELTTINVALSWIHEAQFAGLYAADQYGYYAEQGLRVNFIPYNYEDLAAELVNGKYDFAILQTDTLLEARENGLPVKGIFADYQIIPTVYYSKKDRNIVKPEDLIGKTVAVAYSEKYPLMAMLSNKKIDANKVNIINREYTYDKLASGEYDVEAGWVTDGDAVRAVAGDYNSMSPHDYGVNWYADIISATDEMIEDKPEIVQAFVSATVKGWQKAFDNLDETALLTQKYDPAAKSEHLKFVLEASAPLIYSGDTNIGWMTENVFQNNQAMLISQGIMKKPIVVSEVYDIKFLEEAYRQ
jgi:NitT/TauT family transport system substrate-binding protein